MENGNSKMAVVKAEPPMKNRTSFQFLLSSFQFCKGLERGHPARIFLRERPAPVRACGQDARAPARPRV
jgi:hypothetical protein